MKRRKSREDAFQSPRPGGKPQGNTHDNASSNGPPAPYVVGPNGVVISSNSPTPPAVPARSRAPLPISNSPSSSSSSSSSSLSHHASPPRLSSGSSSSSSPPPAQSDRDRIGGQVLNYQRPGDLTPTPVFIREIRDLHHLSEIADNPPPGEALNQTQLRNERARSLREAYRFILTSVDESYTGRALAAPSDFGSAASERVSGTVDAVKRKFGYWTDPSGEGDHLLGARASQGVDYFERRRGNTQTAAGAIAGKLAEFAGFDSTGVSNVVGGAIRGVGISAALAYDPGVPATEAPSAVVHDRITILQAALKSMYVTETTAGVVSTIVTVVTAPFVGSASMGLGAGSSKAVTASVGKAREDLFREARLACLVLGEIIRIDTGSRSTFASPYPPAHGTRAARDLEHALKFLKTLNVPTAIRYSADPGRDLQKFLGLT